MAAVLDQKEAAAKNGSQVDEQIAQATSRIRAHDLTFGGLVLVSLVLVYTTAMIVLDRYLNLPEWVRQLSLLGFVACLAATAYLTIFSPLRKRINPLYAARQVERTIDDAKNSVTGYVDAQQKGDVNPTVKAALASRAAKAAAEADVNRAVNHNSLIYTGGVAVVFLLALIVLFFVFRPALFSSLVGRAFVPFSSEPMPTRTQLSLVKPEPAEPTITTGQSITVAVHVSGKVPKPDSPERVRLLVRHNQSDPNYDELPMVQGATHRDWELRVPDYLVQNGFWYKVAAGDAVTTEYKVTVRSLPTFTDFQTTYEYPKYLRRKSDTANTPLIQAYRGTTVTLVARANREVRDGLLTIESGNTRVAGVLVPNDPNAIKFVFKLTAAGKYTLAFTATNGERIADPFQSTITLDTDAAPQVVISKPEEEETTEPANGLLKVDGKIGDDFGVDTVTLKMKIVEPAERPLDDVPFLNGKSKSFRREKDGTWPTDVEYKGSVDLAKLKKDAAGLALDLTPDTVIEYWLEATDNCNEPKPNVGRSTAKRVRLTAPKIEEMEKKNLDQQKDNRQTEEKKHTDQQQQKFDNEKRDPKQKGQPNNTGEKPGDPQPDPKSNNDKSDNPPKTPEGKGQDGKDGKKENNPSGAMGDPMMGPNPPMNDPNGMGQPPEAPMPKTPEQKQIEKTAEELKKELDKQNKDGGAAKHNPTPNEDDRKNAGDTKPQPPMGGTGGMNKDGAAETKPEPQQPNPTDPMNKGDSAPSETKTEGNLKQPEDPAKTKPEPKPGNPMGDQKDSAPSEPRNEPIGMPSGTEKPAPKEPQPEPKDPNPKQDPKSGASAKPSTAKKDGEPGMANATEKPDPAAKAGNAKPSPETKRGGEKPKEPPAADPKPQGGASPEAGDAKPEKAPPAGDAKPMPKEGPMPKGMDPETKPAEGANDPMNKGTGAAEVKPEDSGKRPPSGTKPFDKGTDKPPPTDNKPNNNPGAGGPGGGGDAPKQKVDEKQLKELEQAAKDLTNPDPKKKQDARDKLDKAIGKDKREELEQIANDLQSPDKDKQAAAQKKLDDLKKQMQGQANGKEPDKKDGGPKVDPQRAKDIEKAANDLMDKDPKKQQEGRDKLDKLIGPEQRKDLEQTLNDLNSDNKEKQAAAREKIEKWKDEAKKMRGDLTPEQLQADKDRQKEVEEALKDLRGDDPAKKQAARDKLDKTIGRDTRERAEDLFKDLDSNDPEKQKRGQEKLKQWQNETEMKDLLKKAQDLQSKDDKTRQQAEKDLDEKIGKENREKLQEELKNKKLDPKDIEQLKKQLDEWRQALGSSAPNKGPMEDDAKNRLKSAELLLEQFENEENRKALQAKQGWTDAEYEKFLEGYRGRLDQMRKEMENRTAGDKPPAPSSFDPYNSNPLKTGQGGKVEARPGTPGTTTGTGPTAAPPGFEDARRRFEEALKKKP